MVFRAFAKFLIPACFTMLSVGNGLAGELLSVTVPLQDRDQHRSGYVMSVLKLALEHCGCDYELDIHVIGSNQGRNVRILSGRNPPFNLMWTGTSPQREDALMPVRFPLTRGLLGIRLFIIRKDRQSLFDQVNGLDDMRDLLAGQGLNWPDSGILRHAGLLVSESGYDSLFRLLSSGRIDYFPRGANEPFSELEAVKEEHPDLVVENNLAIAYPFDMFFFVNKRDTDIHDAISYGLEQIWRNGKFMENFNSHPDIRALRKKARLDQRRIFVIDNPLLTSESRAIPDEYWETDFSGVRKED